MLHLQLLVPRERLELSILAAVASKTTVYTIPPPGQFYNTLGAMPSYYSDNADVA